MREFKNIDINLGEQKVGKTIKVVFESTESLNNVYDMKSSCGCSVPKIEGNNLVVSYTPRSIPHHLVYQGYYETTKFITITYNDNSREELKFTAKIVK